jgi:hypothetical protein
MLCVLFHYWVSKDSAKAYQELVKQQLLVQLQFEKHMEKN